MEKDGPTSSYLLIEFITFFIIVEGLYASDLQNCAEEVERQDISHVPVSALAS